MKGKKYALVIPVGLKHIGSFNSFDPYSSLSEKQIRNALSALHNYSEDPISKCNGKGRRYFEIFIKEVYPDQSSKVFPEYVTTA